MAEPITHRMRITLDTDTHVSDVGSLHILPCHIKYSGPAPVSDFFHPTNIGGNVPPSIENVVHKSTTADVQKEAYFRGRRLVGTEIVIPPNYVGYVFDTTAPSRTVSVQTSHLEDDRRTKYNAENETTARIEDNEDEDDEVQEMEELSEWQAKTRFDKVVVYGNASKVEESDVVVKGIKEWFALANIIHGEVD